MKDIPWKLVCDAARKCMHDGKRSKNGFRVEFLGSHGKYESLAVFEQNKNKSSLYAEMYKSNKVKLVWLINLKPSFEYLALGLSFDGNSWMFGSVRSLKVNTEYDRKNDVPGVPITIYYRNDNPVGFVIREDSYRGFEVVYFESGVEQNGD